MENARRLNFPTQTNGLFNTNVSGCEAGWMMNIDVVARQGLESCKHEEGSQKPHNKCDLLETGSMNQSYLDCGFVVGGFTRVRHSSIFTDRPRKLFGAIAPWSSYFGVYMLAIGTGQQFVQQDMESLLK